MVAGDGTITPQYVCCKLSGHARAGVNVERLQTDTAKQQCKEGVLRRHLYNLYLRDHEYTYLHGLFGSGHVLVLVLAWSRVLWPWPRTVRM